MTDSPSEEHPSRELGDVGGDPACWAHLLCPECGTIPDDRAAEVCPNCGAELPAEDH